MGNLTLVTMLKSCEANIQALKIVRRTMTHWKVLSLFFLLAVKLKGIWQLKDISFDLGKPRKKPRNQETSQDCLILLVLPWHGNQVISEDFHLSIQAEEISAQLPASQLKKKDLCNQASLLSQTNASINFFTLKGIEVRQELSKGHFTRK